MRRKNEIEEEMRVLIRAEIERALNPGMVDGQTSRRISVTDPDGTRWRGFVWRVTHDKPLTEESEKPHAGDAD